MFLIEESDISLWQFPLSLIMASAFAAGIFVLWKYLPDKRLRRLIGSRWLGIATMSGITVMTAVEGTWGFPLHRTPLFFAFALLMMLSLSFAVLDGIRTHKGLAHIFSHAGLLLVSFGAFWGAPDVVDVQTAVYHDNAIDHALTSDGYAVKLPFTLQLEEFRIDHYDDGVSPKQFTSCIDAGGRVVRTSVNHPALRKGFFIYQADYDHDEWEYSVIKLVRDPWLPLVFIGLILLIAGAFLGLRNAWRSRWLTIVTVLIAILFTALSIARINFRILMPALRSLWFIPHVACYMMAYSSLALSIVFAILAACGVRADAFGSMGRKLFSTASSLLLMGMICGAVWAKMAWGDWWSWDAKECWAAVTWLLTMMTSHLPQRRSGRQLAFIVGIVLSFAAMQMAWYGVEYLQAAQQSMHAYKS